jgi:hypothetical protein
MRWKNFLGRLAIGLGVMTVATSFAIVPPTALPGLLSQVDRPQQVGIALIYGCLILAVVIYAYLDSRNGSGESQIPY